ncbi:MAG: hypothetical protein FJ316_05250 [SAR202 cluster bacterium]|nr:hypothetical protein [SAR202 cluster bacterium]
MTTRRNNAETWRFQSQRSGFEHVATLAAYWEVSGDSISDDFAPNEISADELFAKWISGYAHKYPDGLIPIGWYVHREGNSGSGYDVMPFQYRLSDRNFLTIFTWPIEVKTGKPLNWLRLPVVDKLWNSKRADKGGFIQDATGWKPAILQPYVYLPSLLETRSHQ